MQPTSGLCVMTPIYQWIDCLGNTPLMEQSFTPTESGSYYVIVTKNGCTDESSCQSITVLGTIDTSASLSMTKIYPNPNTGSFTVAFGKASYQCQHQRKRCFG
jgi:hypothetical protein